MSKQRLGTEQVVQREEWVGSTTVVITYEDGTREQMTRKVYEQMIRIMK